MNSDLNQFRFEITIRNEEQINPICQLLNRYNIQNIYITHKTPTVNPLNITSQLKMKIPTLDTITTISSKYYSSTADILSLLKQMEKENLNKILVVSGTPKATIDSVEVLNSLTETSLNLYCVYNPYLTEDSLELEKKRAAQKLANTHVKGIFMQIGTDRNNLRDGIEFLTSFSSKLEIGTSILIPSSEFLERYKKKPWGDVFLNDRYLSNIEEAYIQTKDIFSFALENKITPLIQLMPFSDQTIAAFISEYL